MVENIEATQASSFAGTAPIPPSRPFDLGTIPGAGTQISGPRQASAR